MLDKNGQHHSDQDDLDVLGKIAQLQLGSDISGDTMEYDGALSGEWIVERVSDGYALHRSAIDIKKVFIEVTSRCNLSCENCVRNAWDELLGDMTPEVFDRIIEDLSALPDLREVYIGGYGEPLLHPRFGEILNRIKSLGVRVTLSTNGTLITEEKARALIDAGLDRLYISMDSPDADLFREIRGGSDLDLIMDNLRRVRNMRDERSSRFPTIGLEFVITDKNYDEVKKLPALAREVGASIVLLTHLLPHNEEMSDRIAYGREAIDLPKPEAWSVLAGDFVMWGMMSTPRSRWGADRRCRFVRDKGLVIGWDGGVSPCYALLHSYPSYILGDRKKVSRYVLGNVRDSSLADIWKSREYVLFRSNVTDFRFPSCVDCGLNCDLREQNEDCYANEHSCADCLWAQDFIRCP